ncbi:hypothetical protein VVMO6_02090 [Vibrio vulnificus MO6-24/O]|nr:hypothetical protein VVMO6_02090 [Vibrio vulnificus MO6-24/O]
MNYSKDLGQKMVHTQIVLVRRLPRIGKPGVLEMNPLSVQPFVF